MGDLHLLDHAIVSLEAGRAITRTGDRVACALLGAEAERSSVLESGFGERTAGPREPLLVPA